MAASQKVVDDFQDREATALASFQKRKKRIIQALRQDRRIKPAEIKHIVSALECVLQQNSTCALTDNTLVVPYLFRCVLDLVYFVGQSILGGTMRLRCIQSRRNSPTTCRRGVGVRRCGMRGTARIVGISIVRGYMQGLGSHTDLLIEIIMSPKRSRLTVDADGRCKLYSVIRSA